MSQLLSKLDANDNIEFGRERSIFTIAIAEIQETIDPQEFSYIRSEHNPANALTKGILPEQLEKWSQVPHFLRKPQEEWPKFEENALKINEELSAQMKPPTEARQTSRDKAEFSTAQKELRDYPLFVQKLGLFRVGRPA